MSCWKIKLNSSTLNFVHFKLTHVVERMFSLPAKFLFRQETSGVGGRNISGTTIDDLVGNGFAGSLLESLDHLQHGCSWKKIKEKSIYFLLCVPWILTFIALICKL
jgi:hypothetical protein